MEIYYVNTYNEKVVFNRWPCMIQNMEELVAYEWQSETKEMSNHREKILKFYMNLKKKKVELSIFAESKEELLEKMNQMHRVFERDIIRNSPGKLYVGDAYMSCYCYSGEAKEYEDEFYASDYEIGIMQAKPFWIKEEKFVFEKYNENEISNFLEYPYDYEFDYMGTQKGTSSIEVEHYSESEFEMIIYGPAVNPQVIIGTHTYQVRTTVGENEYLIINSEERTVIRVQQDGTNINEFDNRNFESSIFEKIKPGKQNVNWSGEFGFDITIFKERSAPEWK